MGVCVFVYLFLEHYLIEVLKCFSYGFRQKETRPSRPIRCAVWIVEQMRYRPTNRPTDTASYRGALSHLKKAAIQPHLSVSSPSHVFYLSLTLSSSICFPLHYCVCVCVC